MGKLINFPAISEFSLKYGFTAEFRMNSQTRGNLVKSLVRVNLNEFCSWYYSVSVF